MSGRHGRKAAIAAVGVFVLASIPTALVLISVYSGSVGTTPRFGLMAMAFLVIAAVAASAGYQLRRGFEIVAADDHRNPADAWVAYYVGTVIVVIGTFLTPLLMLTALVNSDRSLADSGIWFFFWWTLGHLIIAALALGAARLVFAVVRRRSPAPVLPE